MEYKDIFCINTDLDDYYLEYLNFTDFNNTNEEQYIESLINNIYSSYEKYTIYNYKVIDLDENELQFYILLILYKMVLESDFNLRNILKLEGISYTNKLNDMIVNYLRNKCNFYSTLSVPKFKTTIGQLMKLGILKIANPFYGSNVSKIMILDFTLKRYIYNIIEELLEDKAKSNYKISHYGILFENIMNMQTSIYSENTFKQLYFKYNQYEVDDILQFKDKIWFVEYKLGEFKENCAFKNYTNQLSKYSSEIYDLPAEYIYVSKYDDYQVYNYLVYLQKVREIYLDKFNNKQEGHSATNKLGWTI